MKTGTDGVVGQDVAGTDDHAESELALGIVPLRKIPGLCTRSFDRELD
jgi:hypothetical protein